uniref:Uncharacterized protein n=1 Tax=Rhizophora mucronata TaxID=61149 RepID=A0A2P2NKS1_RHIMU
MMSLLLEKFIGFCVGLLNCSFH